MIEETLKKIEAYEKMDENYWYKHPNQISELLKYVGENIGWYWD